MALTGNRRRTDMRESQTQAARPVKRLDGQPRRDGASLGTGGKKGLKWWADLRDKEEKKYTL